eukprot:CAMPEP_0184679874 /NCGR_PEP_ID=MMETSP0312-20130426/2754_1 /TAXON_ID=31354 /ORGANISM="Compsopogon coeruleus, Strain SAG 36.94" /LENGTH=90 /DNA_ID=CAMNT_0027129619 /DNA_START=92 /DNA_END=362 /DNA_ORIENTATION=-
MTLENLGLTCWIAQRRQIMTISDTGPPSMGNDDPSKIHSSKQKTTRVANKPGPYRFAESKSTPPPQRALYLGTIGKVVASERNDNKGTEW